MLWYCLLQLSTLHEICDLHLFNIRSVERLLKHSLSSLIRADLNMGRSFFCLIAIGNFVITFTAPTGIFGYIMNLFVT